MNTETVTLDCVRDSLIRATAWLDSAHAFIDKIKQDLPVTTSKTTIHNLTIRDLFDAVSACRLPHWEPCDKEERGYHFGHDKAIDSVISALSDLTASSKR